MKLGIMQPYFFPNLSHFALISAVDQWIVFDITQYTRRSWINRNRVLHPAGGWQYISIPLLNSSIHIKILEAEIASPRNQERYVLGKISHCKRRAPYYAQVCDIVRATFAGIVDGRLVSLNVSGLSAVCDYLGLKFRHRLCSQLALDYPDGLREGQWAPWIAGKLSADAYVNPIGGRTLFNPPDFSRQHISLQFLKFSTFVYDTPGYNFESGLSILDVLMWNSPDTIVRAISANSSLVTVSDGERDGDSSHA
jgi:WbqC-like protein family